MDIWHRRWEVLAALPAGLAIVAGVLAAALSRPSQAPETAFSWDPNGQAPDFELAAADGRVVSLAEFRGKKHVLLYFNTGLGAPPCWQQIVDLEQDGRLEALGVQLISIMVDPPEDLAPRVRHYGLNTAVVSDRARKVCESYRVNCAGMEGKPGHSFQLIGKDGEFKWFRDYGSLMYVEVDQLYQELAQRLREG